MHYQSMEKDGETYKRWSPEDHWTGPLELVKGVLCGKCLGDQFYVNFARFECKATCVKCGHTACVADD